MYSSFVLPQIASPNRTTSSSITLIDNMLTNNCNSTYTSGNLVIVLSDLLAQFLIMENQPNLSVSKEEDQLCCDFEEI